MQTLIELPEFAEYCDCEKLYESTGCGEDAHTWFVELLCNARCDAEDAECSHKFDRECDDPEYADMEYWNTH